MRPGRKKELLDISQNRNASSCSFHSVLTSQKDFCYAAGHVLGWRTSYCYVCQNGGTLTAWMVQHADGVIVRFHIQPKASHSKICGEYGEEGSVRLKIRIAAPPVDGAANEELIRFLKKVTGVPVSRLSIIRGETSKAKDVLFQGVSMEALAEKLKKC